MNRIIGLLTASLLVGGWVMPAASQPPFELQFESTPVIGITAKAARVEPGKENVIVFLTDRVAGETTGAVIRVQSTAKWITLYCDASGQTITKSNTSPTDWIMVGKPGKYKVAVMLFDPEHGPDIQPREVEIKAGNSPQPPPEDPSDPDDPVDPPPPTGDFAALTKVAKEMADKLDQPPIRKALAAGYQAALDTMAGKSYADCQLIVTNARKMALSSFRMTKDWESWRLAVDAELVKAVPAGDANAYRAAIAAIVKGLQ